MDALVQPQRGQVKDVVRPRHECAQQLEVCDAALDDGYPRVRDGRVEIGACSAHEIVEDDDLASRRLGELIDDVGAEEAGAADDQDSGVVELVHITSNEFEPNTR